MKPLDGIRVVDLGIITAGASTSAILADLGADVFKVEGPDYIDPFRRWAGMVDEEGWWDRSPYYRFTNRNKRSLCVDLKSDAGRALLLELVALSDVVVENFRVGVLDRLGLGFSALVASNPRVVLASISSQGASGPDAHAASFGSTLEASSGMASLMANRRGEPQVTGQALNYPDQVVSLLASGMIVAALLDVRATGRATHLDISQREIASFLVGEHIVAAARRSDEKARRPGSGRRETSVAGQVREHAVSSHAQRLVVASGRRQRTLAPDVREGVYRSRDGRWVAVSVRTGESNCRPGFGDAEVVTQLAFPEWIAQRDAAEAVSQLRDDGHAAQTVLTVRDMLGTGDSNHPGAAIVHDAEGFPVKGLPWSIDGESLDGCPPAHKLGADNRATVVEVLQRDEEVYRALVNAGVLANRPRAAADRR